MLSFDCQVRKDYMKRLLQIEEVKAKERQNLGEKSHEGGRADGGKGCQKSDTLRTDLAENNLFWNPI